MRLEELRITNCFGFAETSITLEPNLITILGRNSSGKTALLDAINQLAPQRTPQSHPRFANFRPTDKNPQLNARFTITEEPKAFDAGAYLTKQLVSRGIPQQVIMELDAFKRGADQLNTIYQELSAALQPGTTLRLSKFSDGTCQLTVDQDWQPAKERRAKIDAILSRIFPGGIFTAAGTRHDGLRFTSAELDREASAIIPNIAYFNDRFNLTADLPDHLTLSMINSPPNAVADSFLCHIKATDVQTLLTTNDPDEQDRLRAGIQQRADDLAATISKESNQLLQLTLSPTVRGLQITMRTDGKTTFYRFMSDATKFLFAYHLHSTVYTCDGILLFDEPSKGLHPSAERTMRVFLHDLAKENQVVVATHSEHLIDTDRLDQIRLMQQDDERRPVVINNLRPPRDRKQYLLALQPVFEAIGLDHTSHTLTKDTVVLTEGLTDYLYLRALHLLANTEHSYGITPGRSDSTLLTLAPFMASQGVRLKIILDSTDLKPRLQDAYGFPDTAFFLIPTTTRTRGIEDLFTPVDYQRLLEAVGYDTTPEDLAIGNSAYAKSTNKRVVAQTFLNTISTYDLGTFEQPTQDNIASLLAFCQNNDWFAI